MNLVYFFVCRDMAFHHQESKDSGHNKPSASLLIKLTACASIAASVFAHSAGYGQMMKKTNNEFIQNKDNTERVEKRDSLDHQKIITMDVDSILLKYGKTKGLEIINKHALIELNKIRKENWVVPLQLNPILAKISQNYAEEMFMTKKLSHIDMYWNNYAKRAAKYWYLCMPIWENAAKSCSSIQQVIWARKKSPGHLENIIDKEFLVTWFGESWWYRVNMFSGK